MVQYLLLGGQVLVVLVVYLFVWRVMRAARQDLVRSAMPTSRATSFDPQESTIMPAASVATARRAAGLGEPRLVVDASDVLRAGIPFTIGRGLSLGRADGNDIVLDEGVVSSRHARIVAPGTVVDEGSTNGTYVNGQPATGRVALRDGDIVQVGSTVFRYETGAR